MHFFISGITTSSIWTAMAYISLRRSPERKARAFGSDLSLRFLVLADLPGPAIGGYFGDGRSRACRPWVSFSLIESWMGYFFSSRNC